uniref:Putative ovule protein n=1 Tax=Solanum chacoense TaxID=4108 RepID=A0A0V0GP05_SOLCH
MRMAILIPSYFLLLHIFISVGMGDSNLTHLEMARGNLTELDVDYHYRCSGNLGPCNYEYCDEDCCIRTCNNYYSELNPEPKCTDFPGYYPYKFCICWHDCY